jgi:hypothetical protein
MVRIMSVQHVTKNYSTHACRQCVICVNLVKNAQFLTGQSRPEWVSILNQIESIPNGFYFTEFRPVRPWRKVEHKVPIREWARWQFAGAAGSCGQLAGARKQARREDRVVNLSEIPSVAD